MGRIYGGVSYKRPEDEKKLGNGLLNKDEEDNDKRGNTTLLGGFNRYTDGLYNPNNTNLKGGTIITPTTSTPALTPLQNAKNGKLNAETAFNSFGNLDYTYQKQLGDVMSQILNREKFSYDINGDALYDQYKDKYIQQGKMAMMDTMGQAAAMTGGYGNSYAQSVGQQAYQGHLQNLNDIVPELYQMALDRYNAEGDALYNQYALLANEYTRQSDAHDKEYGRVLDKLNYATNEYDKEYERSLPTNTTEPIKDTSITSLEDIEGWRDAVLGAETEEDAMAMIETLERIDPYLSDELYELLEKKRKKELEEGTK